MEELLFGLRCHQVWPNFTVLDPSGSITKKVELQSFRLENQLTVHGMCIDLLLLLLIVSLYT